MSDKRSKAALPWEEPRDWFYSQRMIPADGYDWASGAVPVNATDAGPEDVLTFKWTSKPALRLIKPLGKEMGVDIHEQLARLEATPTEIREFANTFGWLGIGKQYRLPNTAIVQGESVGLWLTQVATLAFAVRLLQALQAADDAFLRTIVRWDAEKTTVEGIAGVKGKQVVGFNDESVQRWTYGEPIDRSESPLDVYIHETIAKKGAVQLVEFTRWEKAQLVGTYQAPGWVLLASLVNQQLASNAGPFMMIDGRGRRIGHTVPINLVGLAWLQLYRVATGQLNIRVCVVCGKGIDVTKSKATRKMHDVCANRRRVQRHAEKNKGNKK